MPSHKCEASVCPHINTRPHIIMQGLTYASHKCKSLHNYTRACINARPCVKYMQVVGTPRSEVLHHGGGG